MLKLFSSNQITPLMITLSWLQSSTVQSMPFFYRFLLALVGGHLITLGGEFQTISELIKLRGFPVALITSIFIAIIAIEQVHYSLIRLNRKYPTYDKDYTKLRWQIIMCVLIPFCIVFSLATIYYAFNGYFILDTMWLADHGWQVVFMLTVLNTMLSLAMVPPKAVPAGDSSGEATISSIRMITHIIHDKGYNKIYYSDGTEQLDSRSLYDLYQLLNPGEYILNPKKSIIRRDNIRFAGENLEGYFVVELISPKGVRVPVSDRQKKFYVDYEEYL